MTPEYAAAVSAWLAKALSDLASARLLIEGNEPHLDTGSYHCHQAAEKALKGWLTSQQIEFRKTHDLVELLSQCCASEPAFESKRPAAAFLIPFATHFRYPGDVFEPSPDEAAEALAHSRDIVDFVRLILRRDHPAHFE